jgi:AcrR family transcriptional regulator
VKPVGRPRSFDRDTALDAALRVFWERGYEGATLEDLQDAMGGISPPSFYNAFGSKEALFKEAVDRYVAIVGEPTVRALEDARTARQGIEAMLRLAAEAVSAPGRPHGCLLVLGATNCAPASKGAEDYVRAIRQQAPEVIKRRLVRATAEGELSPDVDISAVAAFYATVIHGLGVRAGDGASRADLMSAVDGAMAAWKGLLASSRKRGRAKIKDAPSAKPVLRRASPVPTKERKDHR